MNSNNAILKKHIRQIIKEIYDVKDIDNVTKELEKIVSRYKMKHMTRESEHLYFFMTREIIAKLLSLGYKELGKGATREVYHRPEDPYVIKIANDAVTIPERITANKSEVNIATGFHGLDVREITPKVINYDRMYEKFPAWIIAEKVIPLNSVDVKTLEKVFPTFYQTFKKFDQDALVFSIMNLMSQSVDDSPETVEFSKMPYTEFIEFYCDLVESQYDSKEINEDFIDMLRAGMVKPRDLNKLFVCMKYVQTSDLHEDNIGIRSTGNPTPNDIVILDFDANY